MRKFFSQRVNHFLEVVVIARMIAIINKIVPYAKVPLLIPLHVPVNCVQLHPEGEELVMVI